VANRLRGSFQGQNRHASGEAARQFVTLVVAAIQISLARIEEEVRTY
jgi:hypothetical protein